MYACVFATLGADIAELPCPCRYFNVITRSAMAARSLKEKYLRKAAWKVLQVPTDEGT